MTADEIKAWRAALKLTQTEAAEALGVPVATYRQWEQGRRDPSSLLPRACEAVALAKKPAQRKPRVPYGSLLKKQ